jgi:hypothetical protein
VAVAGARVRILAPGSGPAVDEYGSCGRAALAFRWSAAVQAGEKTTW